MTRTKHIVRICALSLLIHGLHLQKSAEAQTHGRDDSLKPYTSCQFEDGLQIVGTDRLPEGVTSRPINTLDGEKKISLSDGYRVLVAYPKTDFFANVKAEKSNPADYVKDKELAVAGLRWAIAKGKEMEAQEPIKVSHNGFEGYALNRKSLAGNTLGITVLFSDAERHIVTVYFLNQNPKKRKFQTMEEWRTLRDNFLNRYTSCAKGNH